MGVSRIAFRLGVKPGQRFHPVSSDEAKQRIIFSLQTFEFTIDQLKRIEEILNE